jgi:hypothetical protein
MNSNMQTPGLDSQTARLNNRPLTGDEVEDTRDPVTKYTEWERGTLARIGATTGFSDLPPDSPVLIAALAKIKAAGAPEPVVIRETVANQAGYWTVDVYSYAKPLYPSITVRCGEQRLAASPDVVIAELKIAGIIA